MRDQLIESLTPLLADLINKANKGRFQGSEETHKLRISYINALSNLIRAYNTLLKDKEIEDLQKEILELKEVLENE